MIYEAEPPVITRPVFRRTCVPELKTGREIEKMRQAGRVVGEALEVVRLAVSPGVSTKELDTLAAWAIEERGAAPAFLNYCGYPAVLCASVNEEVVHGIPGETRVLREGDIVSLDLGVLLGGYYGDAAITVPVGKVSKQAERLLSVTQSALEKAIAAARPGKRLGDVSSAVQVFVEANGMSVVREFVGHGIGRKLHEDPAVPNFGAPGTGILLEPGMTLAIEPMVNAGGFRVKVKEDGWTAVTADGSLSAHFEHTVALTKEGCEVLTAV